MPHPKAISEWLRGLSSTQMNELTTRVAKRVCDEGLVHLSRQGLFVEVLRVVLREPSQTAPDTVALNTLAKLALHPTMPGATSSEHVLFLANLLESEFYIYEKTRSSTPVPEPKKAEAVPPPTTTPTTPVKDKAMADTRTETKPSKYKQEMTQAAWMIFATKGTEAAQKSIAALLQRNLAADDEAIRNKIGYLMESEIGNILTAMLLSGIAEAFPDMIAEKIGMSPEKFAYAAQQFRIHAMASGGKVLVDSLMDPFVEQMTTLIKGMPEMPMLPDPASRVEETVSERETEKVGRKVRQE